MALPQPFGRPAIGWSAGRWLVPARLGRGPAPALPRWLAAGPALWQVSDQVRVSELSRSTEPSQWMRALAQAPFRGRIYIADYGLDHEELHAPERTQGTLRRYRQHQTDDRVLEDLGVCDLTTHVNFTRLIETAQEGGLKVEAYEHQGRYLGRLGLAWLATLEGRAPDASAQALLRQFHSLTHPGMMGRSFRVLLLGKDAA